ncbi:MAG: methyltransferase domain-containing protein [Solirubrobacteraceae bacterium]
MRLTDFTLDDATGIHMPAGEGVPAGYLDGAERHLLAALPGVTDRSTGSEQLRALMRDWPSLYHLTPYRATIFDCLGFSRAGDARVLELGAGCGAITRWLGEHCGEVHAVEGGVARARVARARCDDLPGVRLYAANYSELDEREAFELVTLIGVLEYGHLYHPEHAGDPRRAALANLQVARRALTPDGVLVLAIENKLGLKYFNGAREDHSGRLFDSIQGYPDRSVPVTFSARELDRLLADAGFGSARFFVAHPDYKLATTIVDAEAARDDEHIHNWLDAPAPDRGASRGPLLFNERLAQRELTRAGLTLELANSFLVAAFPTDPDASARRLGLELGWVARHYSLDRRACFQKRATLRGDVVAHEPAPFASAPREDEQAEVAALVGLTQQLSRERYARGDLVVHAVLETVAAEGLGPGFARHVSELRAWLIDHYGQPSGEDAPPLVRGAAFDATWWNLVATGEHGWVVVDEEWGLEYPLPADFVVWRCLHHFLLRNRLQLPEPARSGDAAQFAARWLRQVAGPLPDELLAEFAALDQAIGLAVAPGALPQRPPALLETLRALAEPEDRRLIVLADGGELAERGELLAAYLDRFGAEDPVRLVLLAPPDGSDALAAALENGVAGPRLGEDAAADVVLTAPPGDAEGWRALAAPASGVLSSRAALPELTDLPHFGACALDELRALLTRAG